MLTHFARSTCLNTQYITIYGITVQTGQITVTMLQEQLKSECVEEFKQGNKQDAQRLLSQIEQPADIRITHYDIQCNL